MFFFHRFVGAIDDFFENIHVDIGEFVDVQATNADFVFAELFEKARQVAKAGHDIERKVLFAW